MEGESLDQGTDPDEGPSGWFLVREADCDDSDSDEEEGTDIENAFDDLGDFIDYVDEGLCQGNSRALFQQQEREEDEVLVQALKRKHRHSTPVSDKQKVDADLSPRLHAISISPHKPAKRRLFDNSNKDSGYSLSEKYETGSFDGQAASGAPTQVQNTGEAQLEEEEGWETVALSELSQVGVGHDHGSAEASAMLLQLMKSSNQRATMLAKFKQSFGMGFSELTRKFTSNKTCNSDWVVAAYGIYPSLEEGLKERLKDLCTYYYLNKCTTNSGSITLMLLSFKAHKCRDTLHKLLRTVANLSEIQLMSEPPKVRSAPAALYWFRTAMSSSTDTFGDCPAWITRQTLLSHQTADEQRFDLSVMIQWALDNDLSDESTIALEYAQMADTDSNAAAWLKTTAQAKHLRDCAIMVRHYQRAIMRSMTMSAWLHSRCLKAPEGGDWKHIMKFLKYQSVEIVAFLTALLRFLKGIPKNNCIAICGPPDTGKSTFAMSLIHFMGGKVLTYANNRSHFWLQPLADARVVLLDDATVSTLDYVDSFLRNALDGNPMCVDLKHRAPMQIKCPPVLLTSNIDISQDSRWRYLHSRIRVFNFRSEYPFNEQGQPIFALNDANWRSFFEKLWVQLDLSDQEDEGENGDPRPPLRVAARRASDTL
nr:MAG: E1 protein [Leptonychotes weddellii papillomavirus 10]